MQFWIVYERVSQLTGEPVPGAWLSEGPSYPRRMAAEEIADGIRRRLGPRFTVLVVQADSPELAIAKVRARM